MTPEKLFDLVFLLTFSSVLIFIAYDTWKRQRKPKVATLTKEVQEETEREKLFDQLLAQQDLLKRAKLMREHRIEYGHRHPMSSDGYILAKEERIAEIKEELRATRPNGSD